MILVQAEGSGLRIFNTVARFGLVGICATLVHLGVAWLLLRYGFSALFANILAFPPAFIVSFSGHWMITFMKRAGVRTALPRFLFISAAGFIINNFALAFLITFTPWHNLTKIVFALFLVPISTFLLSNFWAFKKFDKA